MSAENYLNDMPLANAWLPSSLLTEATSDATNDCLSVEIEAGTFPFESMVASWVMSMAVFA